jgi:hypothetical protein
MHRCLTTIWEGERGVIPVSPRLRAGDEYADVGAVSERKEKVHSLEVQGLAQGTGVRTIWLCSSRHMASQSLLM